MKKYFALQWPIALICSLRQWGKIGGVETTCVLELFCLFSISPSCVMILSSHGICSPGISDIDLH